MITFGRRLMLLLIFGVAMGYFEAALVVYLRQLFYPQGFCFPLEVMPARLMMVEMGREGVSIIILIVVAWLSGQRRSERVGWFLFLFGIWDIFYYLFLKAILNWPASLLDWDVLFLLPLPWIGPVVAPVAIALLMVLMGGMVAWKSGQGINIRTDRLNWVLIVTGTVLILYTFMSDFGATLHQQYPRPFNYWLFSLGFACYLVASGRLSWHWRSLDQ